MQCRPTGTCFDDALEFVIEANVPRSNWYKYTIVHGVCVAPDGHRYAHAWIERGELAIQVMLDGEERFALSLPRGEFYTYYRVRLTTRYTVREAAEENRRTGHYGPWLEQYRQLLGRDNEPRRVWDTGLALVQISTHGVNDDE
jgi:hypothetical protein